MTTTPSSKSMTLRSPIAKLLTRSNGCATPSTAPQPERMCRCSIPGYNVVTAAAVVAVGDVNAVAVAVAVTAVAIAVAAAAASAASASAIAVATAVPYGSAASARIERVCGRPPLVMAVVSSAVAIDARLLLLPPVPAARMGGPQSVQRGRHHHRSLL